MIELAVAYPSWDPHVEVWLLVAALAASYAVAVVRVGPRYAAAGRAPVTRLQVVCFALGVLAVWVAADWPAPPVPAERRAVKRKLRCPRTACSQGSWSRYDSLCLTEG